MLNANKETGVIRMYGDIGDYFQDGVSPLDLIAALDEMDGQDVSVHLNSQGGDVFQGMSIYNQLHHYPGKLSIVIDSIAASIASVIAMAADDVAIHANSMLMIHNPFTVAMGDAREFRSVAALLDKVGGEIASIYARRSSKTAEEMLELMNRETYFTATEAQDIGLVTKVIVDRGAQQQVAAHEKAPVVASAAFPKRVAAKHQLRRVGL